MEFPIRRIAEPRTVRLVPSARLRDPVLRKLVIDNALLDDLTEIEGATSGRLNAQSKGGDDINPREFVAGIPHAHFINAAFAYWRPRELNRFNGHGRGAWYAALGVETCLAEVTFHMVRELERINDFHATVEYAEMFASFAGEFVDLRGVTPAPLCLHPDPATAYPSGNNLADAARADGLNGIIYPSVRHEGNTCLVALRPQAVQSVAQGRIMRLKWAGKPEPTLEIA
ncbi:MAG: RES family NAD+ phosphorylase [Rhodospirillaceae bacterium]|nr:RES family NAD+ phosphorylase [Rhodospirillales bacterium]